MSARDCITVCPNCGKHRVLYQGVCGPCGDAEREEDER